MRRLNRRSFIKRAGLGITFTFCSASIIKSQTKKNPNIIYILADDLGYGDLGCYGQKLIKTPEIDKLCKEGMKFTQHYAGSTVCAPSRCVLLTGLHTGHSYIRGNYRPKNEGQRPIPKDTITIPKLIKKAGYTTGCIGKWGLGGPGTEGEPNKQGFDHWYGYLCQTLAHSYYPLHLWRNGKKEIQEGNNIETGLHYSHDLFTDDALDFISKNKENPFFLYLPYTIPHTKFQVPDLGEYADKEWEDNHKIQAAMISRMDRDVGRIIELLKKYKLNNTLVIFTSDNGAHGKSKTHKKFKASGELRGKKRDLYEGGIRVPMIAWWPGKIKPGSTTGHVSAFWDVMPTICGIAGIEPPKNIDGISFLPTLLNKKGQKKHEYLYWEFYERGGKQAVLWKDWKGIRLNVGNDRNGPIELYNIKSDISEKNNVAEKNPEIVKKINNFMIEAHTENVFFKFKPKKKKKK